MSTRIPAAEVGQARVVGESSLWSTAVTCGADPFQDARASADLRRQVNDGLRRSASDRQQVEPFRTPVTPAVLSRPTRS